MFSSWSIFAWTKTILHWPKMWMITSASCNSIHFNSLYSASALTSSIRMHSSQLLAMWECNNKIADSKNEEQKRRIRWSLAKIKIRSWPGNEKSKLIQSERILTHDLISDRVDLMNHKNLCFPVSRNECFCIGALARNRLISMISNEFFCVYLTVAHTFRKFCRFLLFGAN